MPSSSLAPPRRNIAPAARLLAGAVAAMVLSHATVAASVTGLYEATVPLTDRSDAGQAAAFEEAMRQVLVRVTGRRDAGQEPALAPIVSDARRYVQQFRVIAGNQFFAGFDGGRVERAVTDAGVPLWGHERPTTLVLLSSGEGARATLVTSASSGELKQAVTRAATQRGLPIVWPDPTRPVNVADITSGTPERVRAAAAPYATDAILVGIAPASATPGSLVRWTLIQGQESSQWRGPAEEGPQGAADWLARSFSTQAVGADVALVAIAVSGVSDLRAYAAITDYLQSLSLVRELAVDEVAGDSVIYRARVVGGSERLARAIGLGARLEPLDAAAGNAGSLATLAYRYRP